MATPTYTYNTGSDAPNHPKASNSSNCCMVCGRILGKNPLWFEVNTDWEIIILGSDEKNSQGCWPVGSECAKLFAPHLLIRMEG